MQTLRRWGGFDGFEGAAGVEGVFKPFEVGGLGGEAGAGVEAGLLGTCTLFPLSVQEAKVSLQE